MKARPGALVLLFGLTAEEEKLVRIAGLKWGLRCRAIPPEHYQKPLEQLVANKAADAPAYDGPVPPQKALLLSGVPVLQPFLQQLRRAGLPTSVLKAVLTAENRHWTPLQLLSELQQEHDAIESGNAPAHGQTP